MQPAWVLSPRSGFVQHCAQPDLRKKPRSAVRFALSLGMCFLDQQQLIEYARKLYERRAEGVIVSPAEVEIEDWRPQANECHGNVSTLCRNMEGFTPVRGWLYFDFGNMLPYVLFQAHSVVKDSDGNLWDITPQNANQPYPFIAAEESEAAFQALIESGNTSVEHTR